MFIKAVALTTLRLHVLLESLNFFQYKNVGWMMTERELLIYQKGLCKSCLKYLPNADTDWFCGETAGGIA